MTVVRLRTGLSIVDVDGGKVVLDTRRGVYWHLNPSAMTIVGELDKGRAVDEVVDDIVRDTGADPGQVRSDCVNLVEELRRARLIEGRLS